MLDVFNIATPQGCDIQTFYASGNSSTTANPRMWTKPRGVSHVYMLLIGPGALGDAATAGGGSGAVTVWYGSAQNVPDNLLIRVPGQIVQPTQIYYANRTGTDTTLLLQASNGNNAGAGGAATAANYFGAMGFYQSIAGQSGSAGAISASSTTFLSGGCGGGTATANYGYSTAANGFFQMQPIIVGVGAGGGTATSKAGIGCGANINGSSAGVAGPGFVLIASW